MKKILITSALPYANGPLHFGHIAGAYLPADCYARFQRLQGHPVLFICGSDEHGVAITMTAEMQGSTPKEHVDKYHKVISDFFNKLDISFDHYSRTTWPGHVEPVQKYFKDLVANNYIEKKETLQLYSEKENKFLADRYVVGTCPKCGYDQARGDECQKCGASYEATDLISPKSKQTGSALTSKPTTHWFLMLDKFKEPLEKWISQKNWKPNVTQFAKQYIKELHPRAITRDSKWGVPVPLPDADGKVLYVWFDAPIGYVSATMDWAQKKGDKEAWRKWWSDDETHLVQFMGKDNIPFHAVIFPAMTMGQNEKLKLVDELAANEFYNLEGRRFSKSDGWTIDLEGFFKKYSTDQIRYTIAANAPETSDSEFTWKDFQSRCNAELLGKYGNFVNRTLVFTRRYFPDALPQLGQLNADDEAFVKQMHEIVDQAKEAFSQFKVRMGAKLIMDLASLGNVYFDNKKPWALAKDPAMVNELQTVLALCLECIKCLALISYPVIPDTSQKVWNLLGFDKPLNQFKWDDIAKTPLKDQHLQEPVLLFRKIENEEIENEIQALKSGSLKESDTSLKQSDPKPVSNAPSSQVTFDEVQKIELVVGKIVDAVDVPKSKKLLHLQVDMGGSVRSIVSGIKDHYQPQDLIGKKVIVVANLKPAKLMNIPSEGMILAGSDGKMLEIPFLQNIAEGSRIS
ncbi:MAG: methionine--tRNA ligase [Parachlamydiales bacterium]|nr:methionine--tRNA ligase [Parachlamydiales bacterium]